MAGAASIVLWRAYTGQSPEQDRSAMAARQIEARTIQVSEQLVEKTTALGQSQQDSIDQLQVLQDQVQTVKHLLAEQQNDSKRLSDQVGSLTAAIENLKQSFASAQAAETPSQPSVQQAASRPKPHTARAAPRTRTVPRTAQGHGKSKS
ncbi:hypothetical protein [Bradyrhizobium sp. dw_78]|uniref:hypothetical protein n=1 Tax=Bradyrhizobium sp. dw_78 TaxID=2719793 RepID=UPI003207890B